MWAIYVAKVCMSVLLQGGAAIRQQSACCSILWAPAPAPNSPADHAADSAQASEAVELERAGNAADEAPSLLDEVLSLPVADHVSPTLKGEPKGDTPVSLAWLSPIVTTLYLALSRSPV